MHVQVDDCSTVDVARVDEHTEARGCVKCNSSLARPYDRTNFRFRVLFDWKKTLPQLGCMFRDIF